jgi:peptide/nickel transport system substrate-binding protein/oligopeptide transport system substrate-binding protein
MTADDIVYSFSRLLDPAVRSPRSWFLDKVKGAAEFQAGTAKTLEGVRALDYSTVQITLSEPFAPFISILGLPHLAIVAREEVERLGADFAFAPVGTGPFRFGKWERGRVITLEANEHYFRGRPALDRIQFMIFPGTAESAMARAFAQGELEESPIPSDRRKELVESGRYKVVKKPTLSIRLFGFNFTQEPFVRREVRQAFNYAIDKVRMNQQVRGGYYTIAQGILPPGMPGYNPEVRAYSHDQAKAKSLLAQAGYTGGKSRLSVTLSTSAKSDEVPQEYRAIHQFLGALGVGVELKEFDNWSLFRHALQQGDFQLFRYSWYADNPDPDSF